MDDLVSDDDARSPTVLGAIKDTVHKAIEYALHPTKYKKIWLGTPFNANDPLYEVVESGAWKVNVYPVCEKFPCSRDEFRGAWEDRFTYDFVNEKYQTALALGKVDSFYQELMLQIMSDDDKLILDTDMQWYISNHLMDKKIILIFISQLTLQPVKNNQQTFHLFLYGQLIIRDIIFGLMVFVQDKPWIKT